VNRPTFRSLSVVIASAIVSLSSSPVVAAAQPAPSANLTITQVRDSFTNAGFQVDQANTWDWTSPPVTSLQVHDPAGARRLMVLVYANPVTAQAARLQAQAHEESPSSGNISSADSPHLVQGYGPSVWNRNVALVQTTQSELDRLFQWQNECDTAVAVDPTLVSEPSAPSNAVDFDFQHALDNSVVNL
jgi:hypothetical protein